jgi:hypothetical protein
MEEPQHSEQLQALRRIEQPTQISQLAVFILMTVDKLAIITKQCRREENLHSDKVKPQSALLLEVARIDCKTSRSPCLAEGLYFPFTAPKAA